MNNIVEINEIINDYISTKNTDYSIMITGKWGTGKTHFLRNHVEPNLGDEKEVLYITLNGVSKLEDIDRQIALELYPILDSKGAKVAGGIAATTLKFFKLDGLLDVAKLDNLPTDLSKKIICFDDIERAKLDIEQLLGYINKFVEHLHVKTLLICNERKIEESDLYKNIKEKTVGITVEYIPDYEIVIDEIIKKYEEHDNEYSQFLTENKDTVYNVFTKSKTGNIRILKQGLIYYKKVFFTIKNSEIENINNIAILKFLLSTFFEFRAGFIDEEVFSKYLQNEYSFWVAKHFNKKDSDKKVYPEVFLNKYYDGIDSDICTLITVFDYIKTGYLNIDVFEKELTDKFSVKDEDIEKKSFITERYWAFTDEEFSVACNEILKEIQAGHPYKQSYYLKLFYYFLHYSRIGAVLLSPKDILDVFTEGISIAKNEWEHQNIDVNFIISEEPKDEEYKIFKERLFEANDTLELVSKEEKAKTLLNIIDTEFENFIDQFGLIKNHDFIQIPVFEYWKPDDITDHILSFSNNQIVEFHKAFRHRYSIGNTWQHYITEVDNLCIIIVKIKDYVEKNPGKLSSCLLLELTTQISSIQKELTEFRKKTTQQIN